MITSLLVGIIIGLVWYILHREAQWNRIVAIAADRMVNELKSLRRYVVFYGVADDYFNGEKNSCSYDTLKKAHELLKKEGFHYGR